MLLHDYRSYISCQEQVDRHYADRDAWLRSSILNAARMGKFSSDRSIRQYCEEVWKVTPVSAGSNIEVKTCSMKESA